MRKFSGVWHILLFTLCLETLACLSMEDAKEPQIEKALQTQQAIIINHLNRGEPEKAFAELRPAMQRFPDNNELVTLMGLTQLALRNPAMAIKHLKKAYANDPSSTTVLNLSSAYIESGQNVAALKLLRRHVKEGKIKDYNFPERIYHNIGLAYRNIKKTKSATKYFRQALSENPKFYLSLMQMGEINMQRKNYKVARNYYRKALPACNQCYEALTALTSSYVKSGNRAGAATVLEAYANNKQIPNDLRIKARKELAQIMPVNTNHRSAKNTRAPKNESPQPNR